MQTDRAVMTQYHCDTCRYTVVQISYNMYCETEVEMVLFGG